MAFRLIFKVNDFNVTVPQVGLVGWLVLGLTAL